MLFYNKKTIQITLLLSIVVLLLLNSGFMHQKHNNTNNKLEKSITSIASEPMTIDFDNVVGNMPEYYGSNVYYTDDAIDLIKEYIIDSNMNIIRLDLHHIHIENPNDNADPNNINWTSFNFSRNMPWHGQNISYNTIFDVVKELNLTVMVCPFYIAPWLSANNHAPDDIWGTYPPNNYDEYYEFIYATLLHMVDNATIHPSKIIFEPFNEPDTPDGLPTNRFWANHSYADTAFTYITGYHAAKNVSTEIKVIGMDEWDNGRYLDDFIQNYNGLKYLDGIAYHEFHSGNNFDFFLSRGLNYLQTYDLPVFINAYGSWNYGGSGMDGALWNSFALTTFLFNGIQPLQFPFIEFPGLTAQSNNMSLIYNWENNWTLKESYWVYANIFGLMKNTHFLNVNENIQNFDVLAGKTEDEIRIIITNRNTTDINMNLTFSNLPIGLDNVSFYNNTRDNDQLDSIELTTNELVYNVPALNTISIVIANTTQSSSSQSSSSQPSSSQPTDGSSSTNPTENTEDSLDDQSSTDSRTSSSSSSDESKQSTFPFVVLAITILLFGLFRKRKQKLK